MPKVTLQQKAAILGEVRRKATDKFHTSMHNREEESAEALLEQDLLNLE